VLDFAVLGHHRSRCAWADRKFKPPIQTNPLRLNGLMVSRSLSPTAVFRQTRQLGWVLIRRRAFQVRQNPRDDLRLLDAGHHPELPAATGAGLDVDTELALQPLRTTDIETAPSRRALSANAQASTTLARSRDNL
jgi:hypothetical protein